MPLETLACPLPFYHVQVIVNVVLLCDNTVNDNHVIIINQCSICMHVDDEKWWKLRVPINEKVRLVPRLLIHFLVFLS